MSIERREPLQEIMSFRERVNHMIDDMLMRPRDELFSALRGSPALDMYETDGKIAVEVALPGVKPEEVEVNTTGHTLTIKGERQTKDEVKEENYYRHEQHYGAFMRSVTLPEVADVEHPEANFTNGVLKVTFPKVASAQSRRIDVKA